MTESSSKQIQIPDFDETSIRRMVEFLYKDTFTDIDDTSYEDFISLLAIVRASTVYCMISNGTMTSLLSQVIYRS